MNKILLYLCLIMTLTACMVGPKFKSPQVTIPQNYIEAQSDTLGEMRWWANFQDTTLMRLLKRAIKQNRTLAMAVSAIDQAQITLRATRAQFFPDISYNIDAQYGTETHVGTKNDKPTQTYSIKPAVSWELGLFGRVRRMSESQRNDMYATEMAARGVLISLTAEVASTYFTYLQYEYSRDAAQQIYESQKQTLALQIRSFRLGAITELALEQASVGLHQAEATVMQMQRAMAQTSYALSLLLGENPSAVVGTHTPLTQMHIPDPVPPGIPAALLNRRPDIMEAYYQCASANAMIGVAQAQRLPSIALTGSGGLLSMGAKDLFQSGSWLWSVAGAVTGPIFSFGQNKRQVELSRQKSHSATLNYQQSVLTALQDVESSLVAVSTLRLQIQSLKLLKDAAQNSYVLSGKLYQYGQITSQNMLDAQRTLLNAQITYSQSMSELMSSYSTLYKALGGGYYFPEQSYQKF